jgi:hypothetical protein
VRLKKEEFRTSQNTFNAEYRRVLINGPYDSTIRNSDRCQWNDRDWAIISIVTDVTATFTELLLESIEPGEI